MASKSIVRLLHEPNKLICKVLSPSFSVTSKYSSSFEPKDQVTHTGQVFDSEDRRLARFVDRQKEVNPNWAVKLIADVPPMPTKAKIVACDGGGGPLGHPKVYINLDKPGNHSCGYCGLRFYKEGGHHHH